MGRTTRTSRGLSPDEQGLDAHAEPLKIMLAHCPTGFPSHPQLRSTFERLQEQRHICGADLPAHLVLKETHVAADAWRIMTKHVYALARKTFVSTFPGVNELLAMIRLPTAQHREAPRISDRYELDGLSSVRHSCIQVLPCEVYDLPTCSVTGVVLPCEVYSVPTCKRLAARFAPAVCVTFDVAWCDWTR